MTSNVAIFKELDKGYASKVKVGNGQYVDVKGKGTVTMETQSDTKIILEVLYVPDIDQNLISVGQLLEKDYVLLFKNMACIIFDPNGDELMTVRMNQRSFPLKWKDSIVHTYTSQVNDSLLWHRRFGHFNNATLKHMHIKGLAQNMPSIYACDEVCDVCQFGKQRRLPFLKNQAWRATQKLQLIHTDIYGLMRTPSLSGNKYFVLFIDDLTRMCWV